MINKKNLWFLTLFSLVLVLSIYYVTMPSDVFESDLVSKENENINIEEVNAITSMKLDDDALVLSEMNKLKEKLINKESNNEEKNLAFEELKLLNKNSSKEETIENKIKEDCSCETFVKIDGDNIRVVLDSDDNNVTNANKIMRMVQEEFDEKKFISVKFN